MLGAGLGAGVSIVGGVDSTNGDPMGLTISATIAGGAGFGASHSTTYALNDSGLTTTIGAGFGTGLGGAYAYPIGSEVTTWEEIFEFLELIGALD